MVQKIVLLFLLTLSGCYGSGAWYGGRMHDTDEKAKVNNQKIMRLNIGDSKDSLLMVMGQPNKRESYQIENNRVIDFLFYRTSGWRGSDGGDRDYQFTPFAFENGRLTGWGRNFYDNVVRHAVEVQVK